jgi:hypothetical protein
MTTDELLSILEDRGLRVEARDEGRLVVVGDPAQVTPALRRVLAFHRAELARRAKPLPDWIDWYLVRGTVVTRPGHERRVPRGAVCWRCWHSVLEPNAGWRPMAVLPRAWGFRSWDGSPLPADVLEGRRPA